jgi:hypothetical protein
VADGPEGWTNTSSQRSEGIASARDSTGPSRESSVASPGEQHDIGLAQAQPAPGRVLRVGLADDVIVAAFHSMQPPGQLVPAGVPGFALGRSGAEVPFDDAGIKPDDRTGAGQQLRQLRGEPGGRTAAGPGRGDGDGPAARGWQLGPVHGQQPVHQQARYLAEQARSPFDQGVEGRDAQQQVAVPDGADRRRPGPVAEQRDLSDDRPSSQIVQDPLGAAGGHRDPQAAAEQEEEPIACVVLGYHHIPGGHVYPFELLGQLEPERLVKGGEEGNAGQERVQFARVMPTGHVSILGPYHGDGHLPVLGLSRLLSAQRESRRGPSRGAPRPRRHQVDEDQRAQRYQDQRADRDGRLGYRVDLPGEQRPEPPAEGDAGAEPS